VELFCAESGDSSFFLSLPAEFGFWNCGSGRGEEPSGEMYSA
jgi:hypothetical protein